MSNSITLNQPTGLAAIRESRGKTQIWIARKLQCNQGSISAIETRENLEVETLRRYVKALGGTLILIAEFEEIATEINLKKISKL